MTTSFVLHTVADYDAWRRVYDSGYVGGRNDSTSTPIVAIQRT